MYGVNVLQNSVSDGFVYCYTLLDAQASMFHTHILPVWLDIWADTLQSFLVLANYSISYLFQGDVFSGQDGQQFFAEDPVDRISHSDILLGVYGTSNVVVLVLDEVFVAGVVLGGELSEKVTRAFVGVDLVDLVLVILEILVIGEICGDYLNLHQLWALSGVITQLVHILQCLIFAVEMQQIG